MKRIRLGAGILNQTPLDWVGNTKRVIDAVREARQQQVTILCLPELCLSGYGCEDMFLSPAVWKTAWQMLQKVVPETSGMVVSVGLPLYVTNGVYNAACVIADGHIVGFVAKQHLAGDGLHYEPRWFRAWPAEVGTEFHHGDSSWPIGDLLFECDGIRIGFEICEDAWVAGRPGNRMAECGVDVILNPSASHFAFGKHEIRKRFVLEGSRSFGVSYVYANLVGNEAGRAIYDGGALIASSGDLIAAGPRFGFHEYHVTLADVDVELTRSRRAAIHSLSTDVRDDVYERIVRVPGKLSRPGNDTSTDRNAGAVPSAVSAGHVHAAAVNERGFGGRRDPLQHAARSTREDEFTKAISLALFDYLRKSRSHGFVVSMSGGADSSAMACLIRCMVERGLDELGTEGFLSRLEYIPSLAALADVRPEGVPQSPAAVADNTGVNAETRNLLMSRLFTGIYQATRNSGDVTRAAAAAITQSVGGTYYEIDVDQLVQQYTSVIENAIGRQLSWQKDDITLQNIQARTRSPSVWMLANLNQALLLSTSNRSEAAVGYATMDGDTSGGLSPIAGIDKAFLRQWLRVMEIEGSGGCPPIAALQLVNQQQPTAELRPAEYAQTDEGDLMPYPLLDQIERLAIRDKLSPAEVLETLQREASPYDKDQLTVWVKRFFRLWSRNQWKRERYAPSFHVDDKNLDPKTWCRFPILSGGFEFELDQL